MLKQKGLAAQNVTVCHKLKDRKDQIGIIILRMLLTVISDKFLCGYIILALASLDILSVILYKKTGYQVVIDI